MNYAALMMISWCYWSMDPFCFLLQELVLVFLIYLGNRLDHSSCTARLDCTSNVVVMCSTSNVVVMCSLSSA
jgi:hypothetical protein